MPPNLKDEYQISTHNIYTNQVGLIWWYGDHILSSARQDPQNCVCHRCCVENTNPELLSLAPIKIPSPTSAVSKPSHSVPCLAMLTSMPTSSYRDPRCLSSHLQSYSVFDHTLSDIGFTLPHPYPAPPVFLAQRPFPPSPPSPPPTFSSNSKSVPRNHPQLLLE